MDDDSEAKKVKGTKKYVTKKALRFHLLIKQWNHVKITT